MRCYLGGILLDQGNEINMVNPFVRQALTKGSTRKRGFCAVASGVCAWCMGGLELFLHEDRPDRPLLIKACTSTVWRACRDAEWIVQRIDRAGTRGQSTQALDNRR